MKEIVSGVTVMTKFIKVNDVMFCDYIDYMDRDEATRTKNFDKFNIYNDYMGNPKKSSGLFTKTKEALSSEEKKELKKVFEVAQDNGSLMWQTVISFDNSWLAKYGLYDLDTKVIHEKALQKIVRVSVNKMLEKEGLENAVWSGSFHYNTDNLHVHIATVEPIPSREKRRYIQKDEKGNVLYDKNGNKKTVLEYKGVFKLSSIEECKSMVVNQIIKEKSHNIEINKLVRDTFLKQKKDRLIEKDKDLSEMFLKIYNMLPETQPGLWKYGNNNMKSVRPELDKLTIRYLEKYHEEEFEEFKSLVSLQEEKYRESYGKERNKGRSFQEGKLEDLKKRMGNLILKEMIEYSKNIKKIEEEEQLEKIEKEQERKEEREKGRKEQLEQQNYEIIVNEELISKINMQERVESNKESSSVGNMIGENQLSFEEANRKERESDPSGNKIEENPSEYFISWTETYIEAKKLLNNKDTIENAIELFQEEEKNGNILADFDLGLIYKLGLIEKDSEKSEFYYKTGFEKLMILDKTLDTDDTDEGQIKYKLSQCYLLGRGVEKDYQKAKEGFEEAAMLKYYYANFSLAGMYFYGNGINKDLKKAFSYYKKTIEHINFPFAHYQLAIMYRYGIGTEINEKESNKHYQKALEGFIKMDENIPDVTLQYKIGLMYLKGMGTEKNEEQATKYLLKAAELKNTDAQYLVAKIYLEKDDLKRKKEGIKLLKESAENGNGYAQTRLGKEYLSGKNLKKDVINAEKWLIKAVEEKNHIAEYMLGREYLTGNNFEKKVDVAEELLTKVAENGNEYAQYLLGKEYLSGTNLKKNIKKSKQWLQEAERSGNYYAKYMLGKEYISGENYKKDIKKGLNYLKDASEQGEAISSYTLGKMYYYGDKVKKNRKKGIKYLKLSAKQGNEYAEHMLSLIQKNEVRSGFKINFRNSKINYEIESAMRKLKKSLNNESQKMKNMREHERLVDKEVGEGKKYSIGIEID